MSGMASRIFGDPADWPDQDLIGLSDEFSLPMVIDAYTAGVFPMPLDVAGRQEMGWFSPVERGILPLDALRIPRSLRKMIKRYEVTFDTAFGEVVRRCADPSREGAWIDDRIVDTYTALHIRGLAHSVEARNADGELVGGLYGVAIGGLFAGESMFHDQQRGRDASKTALVALVERLRTAGGPRLLDVQWLTPHLASLGVVEVSRTDYLARLSEALTLPSLTFAP